MMLALLRFTELGRLPQLSRKVRMRERNGHSSYGSLDFIVMVQAIVKGWIIVIAHRTGHEAQSFGNVTSSLSHFQVCHPKGNDFGPPLHQNLGRSIQCWGPQ